MNDIFYDIPKTQALLDCEAKLLRMKKRMLRRSRRKYADIIPVAEQIQKYNSMLVYFSALKQLVDINRRIYPINVPVFFGRPPLSQTPMAIYQRRRKASLRQERQKNGAN